MEQREISCKNIRTMVPLNAATSPFTKMKKQTPKERQMSSIARPKGRRVISEGYAREVTIQANHSGAIMEKTWLAETKEKLLDIRSPQWPTDPSKYSSLSLMLVMDSPRYTAVGDNSQDEAN